MSYKHITRDDIERSENTNTLNTQQWNLRENLREKQQDGGSITKRKCE